MVYFTKNSELGRQWIDIECQQQYLLAMSNVLPALQILHYKPYRKCSDRQLKKLETSVGMVTRKDTGKETVGMGTMMSKLRDMELTTNVKKSESKFPGCASSNGPKRLN